MQPMGAQRNLAQPGQLIRRPRVLLVDEDPRDRDHYRRMLHDSGFDVSTSSDFTEAGRLLERENFDGIVVSQGGPDFKGRTVLEDSVAKDRYRPVVVLSRYHDVGCYLEAMQLGAVDYLEKPLSALEIVRVLTTHLHSKNVAA